MRVGKDVGGGGDMWSGVEICGYSCVLLCREADVV